MSEAKSLKGKTIFMSGGSRGIGLAIALKAARDGANVTIAAKTAEPHPKLPGTIYTAAEEIEAAGGKALPVICDIRDEAQVGEAVEKTVAQFGGIDICVNNASAIQLTGTLATDMKRFDLMHQINTRGTYLVSKMCIPHLKGSDNPHIVNLAPPLDMKAKWFKNHVAYTMAKFGMSMCTLGMSAEFAKDGIAINSLWPLTAIDTAAVRNLLGGETVAAMSRTPEILADAFHAIVTKPSREVTGNFFIDELVLRDEGVTDFSVYAPGAKGPLAADFFVPDEVFEMTDTKVAGMVG
ncbi:MAG: NAD(P)-dependent oxidoreductase [Rhizobiaceae bacterium]|nr:NAD(P)-dependent oxidoreductase [Rhizobiaceae bacterium]